MMKLSLRLLVPSMIIALSVQSGLAQQFNFSQYSFTDQRINPALVGIGNYWKFSGLHREQNTGPNFDIKSTAIAASYPLVRPNNAGVLGGIGISLLNDKAGEGKAFKVQEIGISYAMQVKTGVNQALSLGVSGFRQVRRFSFDDLVTNSQFIPNRGFDTSLDNGESFEDLRRSFYRVGLGLHWEKRDANNLRTAHLGISSFDLNQPEEAFVDAAFKTSTTYLASLGFRVYEAGPLSIYPEALYSYNGDQSTLNAGVNVRYSLAEKGYLVMQGQYLTGDEFVTGFQFGKDDYRFGVSYDFPLGSANAGNRGALEFGFEFSGLVESQRKVVRRKKRRPKKKKKKTPTSTTPPIRRKRPEENPKPEVKEPVKEEIKEPVKEVSPPVTKVVEPPVEKEEIKTATGAEGLEYEPIEVERITKRFGFDFNKAVLSDEMKTYLGELSVRLKEEPYLKVSVVGHTDDVGNNEVNQRLSASRAEAVKNYLVSMGIAATRISAEGRGELEPVGSNTTENGRALNRRVELIIHR